MSNTPRIGDGAAKTLGLIFIFLVFFIAEYWYIILPITVIGVGLFVYSKMSHSELQRKSLETDIRLKENQIEMSHKEMELRQMELKAQMMDLQSKMSKRGAKTEQIDLTNEVIKQKLGKNPLSNYNDQINNLQ